MSKKYLMFLLLVCIMGMFLVSSVCASDLNETSLSQIDDVISNDDALNNLQLDEADFQYELNQNIDSQVLSKNIYPTSKTFAGINDAIASANEGDTILLDGEYYLPNLAYSNENSRDTTIYVNKRLNFVGINDATIIKQGNDNLNRVASTFNIVTNGVTFKDITFADNLNGFTHTWGILQYGGGAIHTDYSIEVDGCKFINCYSYYNGGAINIGFKDTAANSISTIKNSKFINCYINESNQQNYGGAISVWNSNLMIDNCSFSNNHGSYGGAISIRKSVDMVMTNCYFDANHAKWDGGAILNYLDSSLMAINCSFDDCYSDSQGGVISNYNSSLTFVNSSFEDCHSVSRGGVVHSFESNLKFANCSFDNCTVNSIAGALDIEDSRAEIVNCSFDDCYAASHGGAIINLNANVTMSNNTFTGNHVGSHGGAVYNQASSLKVQDCSFYDCYSNEYGGALDNLNSILTVVNCLADNCHANQEGGVFNSRGSGELNCFNSTFTNCYNENKDGGVLWCENIDLNMADCNFLNNHGSLNGGVIYFAGSSAQCSISNSSFEKNSAVNGGSIYINSSNCNLSNCLFENNAAKNAGVFYSVNSNLNISCCNLTNNYASDVFGAINGVGNGHIAIEDSLFNNCTSKNSDEYIKFSDSIEYDIDNCKFDVIPEGISYHFSSILEAEDASIIQSERKLVTVTLCNVVGPLKQKKVVLTLNGEKLDEFYTFDDGTCSFYVNDYIASVGDYTLNLSYAGDEINRPVSKDVKIRINEFRWNLTVLQDGKYYGQTSLTFKVVNSETNHPVENAFIDVVFSNGVKLNDLKTGRDGEVTCEITFVPGSYNFTAKINDARNQYIDVNAVEKNLTIFSLTGIIDVVQNGRFFTFKTYNPDSGDVFGDIVLNIRFSNLKPISSITNNQGIFNYNFPGDNGTYNVQVNVNGNSYMKFNSVELKNIVINTKYDPTIVSPIFSEIIFGNPISFDYLNVGSSALVIVGGTVGSIEVLNHPESKITVKDKMVYVSNLAVGTYTLKVVTNPDANHYSTEGTLKITVNKVIATVKASKTKITVTLKKNNLWKITIMNSKTGKPIGGLKLTLNVYTGKNCKPVSITTNSNGVASYQTKSLAKGNHKIVVSTAHKGYKFSPVTFSINVIKPKLLKFRLHKKVNEKRGSLVTYQVLDKKTKKGVNGVKVKFMIYTGKKYKTITLKTKKVSKYKGIAGIFTNEFSVGKHKVVIKPVSIKYDGSGKTTIKIKKSAKKYPAKTTKS